MSTKEIILGYIGKDPEQVLSTIPEDFFEEIEEIRLRADKPVLIYLKGKEYFITRTGQLTGSDKNSYKPKREDVYQSLEMMSRYSMYAFEEELRKGYVTLPGGHRVGITGQAVLENNWVKTLKNINGLNIRISHQVKGCGDKIILHIASPKPLHTMIISPPACGKTTLLRDIVRLLSDGVEGSFPGRTVGVVDERSEIAGCYQGIPQNDIGTRTDVLDGCPKAEGMMILLRSMTPAVIAVDEIGSAADIRAIEDIVNAGIKLICTVHGKNIGEVRHKPLLGELMNKGIFQRYITLSAPGKISGVFNEEGERFGG